MGLQENYLRTGLGCAQEERRAPESPPRMGEVKDTPRFLCAGAPGISDQALYIVLRKR